MALTLADILVPALSDADSSETFLSLSVTVEGLPAAGVAGEGFDLGDIAGLPAGVTPVLGTGADGTQTLSFVIPAGLPKGTPEDIYAGIVLTLPTDFSTTNRSDLGDSDTARPLTLTLRGADRRRPGPRHRHAHRWHPAHQPRHRHHRHAGLAIDLPATVTVAEDGGVVNGTGGVTLDLGLDPSVTDDDGSETADTSDPRFAAEVTVTFTDLPAGATTNIPGLNPVTGIWTGSVADAQTLTLSVPANYAGTIRVEVTLTSPEGSVTTSQTLIVTPVPDVIIAGDLLGARPTTWSACRCRMWRSACPTRTRPSAKPRSPSPACPRAQSWWMDRARRWAPAELSLTARSR